VLSFLLFSIVIANGKYCLTGGHDRTVRLWNPLRIDPAFPPPANPLPPLPGQYQDEHDSTSSSLESLARALPIQTYSQGYTHPISAIATNDNNNNNNYKSTTTLAAASNKTLIITDMVTQQVQRRFHGHTGRINAVAISEACETYLSASYDGTVKVWDGRSHTNEPIMTLSEAKDSVTDLLVLQQQDHDNNTSNQRSSSNKKHPQVYSSTSTALIRTASVDGMVRTYDIRKGNLAADDCGSPITGMASSWDNQCLAINCLDGSIRLMELDSGILLHTYTGSHKAGHYGLACAMTADDTTLVTGSEDGNAVLYDIMMGGVRQQRGSRQGTTNKAVQILQGHTRPTCSIATHPKRDHASVVITASYDGTAIVWAHEEGFMKWEDG
jgi:mitogen-activated protein kinase organizer 1